MTTIWKYPVATDRFALSMPVGAKVLSCAMQGGNAVLWAMVDPDAKSETRMFSTVGTGHLHGEYLKPENFVGTLVMERNGLVFHLFEET